MLLSPNKDDLDKKLDRVVKDIVFMVADSYRYAYDNGKTTSVSNYMKTDPKYQAEIVAKFAQALGLMIGDDLKACIDIFER